MPLSDIHNGIATIIAFSVRETNPSGTLDKPPTHAHLSVRASASTVATANTAITG